MKSISLAIAAVAVLAVLHFLTIAPSIDPCNPPRPRPEAVAVVPMPGMPAPTLAPVPPPQHDYDSPAHIVYVTVEADLQPNALGTRN